MTVCTFWIIRMKASESVGGKVRPMYMDIAVMHVELIPADTNDTM